MTEAPVNASGGSPIGAVSAAFTGDAGQGQTQPQELAPEQDHSRYRQLRDAVQKELNTRVERTANDPELDAHAKDWKLGTLWDSAVSADAKVSEFYEKELADNVAKEEQRVYRIPSHLQDSVRSAYSQVVGEMDLASYEEGDSTERLERLYDRARRTGDKALQLACYHRAVELDIHWLRDEHLSTSPELSQAFEGYNLARAKLANWGDKEQNLIERLDGRRGLIKPPEVR